MSTFFLQYLEDLKKEPEQLLQDWTSAAEQVKVLFLQQDLPQLWRADPYHYIGYLEDVLAATAMFMDDTMNAKLAEIKFPPCVTRWFIPLEAIINELNALEASGEVTIPRTQTLVLIKAHVDANLQVELHRLFALTTTVNKNAQTSLKKDLIHRVYRKRNKITKQFPAPKNEQEKILMDTIVALEEATNMPDMIEKSFKQISGGLTNKFILRSIVDSDEVHKRTNTFYRQFFYLFKLIKPDFFFQTAEELVARDKGYHSMSHLVYQAKIIKWLIR